MTVRMPGEECLTRTQEAQRAFREKFIEKKKDVLATGGAAKTASGEGVSTSEFARPVGAATRSDASLVVNKDETLGRVLNLTV